MHRRLALALALVLLAAVLSGCGAAPPPDEATSKALVAKTVIDWHRYQAFAQGDAGCRLPTKEQQERLVKGWLPVGSGPRPDTCVKIVDQLPKGGRLADAMLATVVDSVRIDGERAVASAHTTIASRSTSPVDIPLRWVDGRWLIN